MLLSLLGCAIPSAPTIRLSHYEDEDMTWAPAAVTSTIIIYFRLW